MKHLSLDNNIYIIQYTVHDKLYMKKLKKPYYLLGGCH